MKQNYDALAQNEEHAFAADVEAIQRTQTGLDEERAALVKEYKREMANHESAQPSLCAQLNTARLPWTPGCMFFNMSDSAAPPAPHPAHPAHHTPTPLQALEAEDPRGPEAQARAKDLARHHNLPL